VVCVRGQWTIGITGRRRLPPGRLPLLTKEIQLFYETQKERYGAEHITVLSPLAEGADMLCAGLAAERGLRLVVPLPLGEAEYRKDFSEAAAAEFDRLISVADEVFTVTPHEAVPAHPQRGFYYRQAGIYVARNCDVLLAVWDGVEKDTRDGAGTWETVKLARKFGKPVHRAAIGEASRI
jgi:hypothetical protein